MENPLDQIAPSGLLERAEAFARDLAYGVVQELWQPKISRFSSTDSSWEIVSTRRDADKLFQNYVQRKWAGRPPSMHLMQALGYLDLHAQPSKHQNDYIVTEKALLLLVAPAETPTIYVAYTATSSALALLVEARLKVADPHADVFVNRAFMLEGAIPAYLRERILSSRYFVVLLGQSQTPTGWQPSLSSRTLLQQLSWALEADKTVIAITHSGYSLPETQGDLPSDTWRRMVALHEGHLLTIPEETTSAHDTALSQLLNILGYGAY